MNARSRFKDLTWLIPFVFLGLVAVTMMRPWPVFPTPAHGRIITDGQGDKVEIPLPVHIITGTGGGDYLELTHAPEALYKAGSSKTRSGFSKQLMARFYPQLLENESLWNGPSDVEARLAQDDGATYFEWNPTASRRLGFAAVALAPKDKGDFRETLVRVENAALGQEQQGEAVIADYRQAYADLKEELRPETLTSLPRTLPMGASKSNWSNIWISDDSDTHDDDRRAGVVNASIGFKAMGRFQEAERLLAMNPDFIFAGSTVDFLHDPRWQGLKAVLNRRVYGGGTGFTPCGPSWGLDASALALRLEAEIVHPDRLKLRIRELTRSHFLKAYGYHLSDDEIDKMLGVEEQKSVPGFERFTRSSVQEAVQ